MVAKEGFQETAPNGDRFLVMLNGTRYEGVPGQADFKIVEFERYAMRIEPPSYDRKCPISRRIPRCYLLQNPTTWNMSELEWRIGLPLSALILALLAIPLSYVNPRAGRSLNLIIGDGDLHVLQQHDQRDQLLGRARQDQCGCRHVWGIHLLMFTVMLILFYHRSSASSWRRLRR